METKPFFKKASAIHSLRMEVSKNSENKTTRQKFTAEEDARLSELVRIHGNRAWKKIASIMKTRTTRQCRERYINYLSPNVTNGPWSAQEDSLLVEKVHEMGPKWSKIAKFFQNRSDVNIKNRYALFVSKGKAPPLPPHHRETSKQSKPPTEIPEKLPEISVDDLFETVCNEEEDQGGPITFTGSEPENVDWSETFDFSFL